jgi:hypothetical protein
MATASNLVGLTINVEHGGKKGTVKEEVVKHLKNGTVRTAQGSEFQADQVRNVGRGKVVTLGKTAGGAKPKVVASAATENTRKAPAERPAPAAVLVSELEGKKVNGSAVVKISKRNATVELETGEVINVADVKRVGRGFATESNSAAPAPKANGGARAKAKPAADEGEAVTNNDIRATVKAGGLKIRIDGKLHTIISTVTGEKFKTDKGYKGQTGEIRNVGGKYVLETAEYKAAQAPAPAPKAEVKGREPAPITRAELKGKNITVGDVVHVIEKTLKSDEVVTDKGMRFAVADVARKGRGYIYTGEIASKKGGAVPRARTAPEPVSKIVEVAAFDYDTVADVRDLLEKAIRTALADAYDVDVAGTFVQFEDQMATISFQISTADAPASLVKAKVESFRAGMEAQAIEAPAPASKGPKAGEDFAPSDLVDEEDEDEEENEEEENLDSEEDEDEFAEETDGEENLDSEEDEDDTDFPEEEEENAEIAFPEDTTQLVENGVARLAKFFPGKNMNGFVSRWYASQEAFDAIGYDLEPGMTVTIDDADYALVGLKTDGNVMLVNAKTSAARPAVDLDALQIIVAEDQHNA